MTQPIRLKCRSCDEQAEFDSVDEVKMSAWMNTSPLGALKEGGIRVHRSDCPEHSFQ